MGAEHDDAEHAAGSGPEGSRESGHPDHPELGAHRRTYRPVRRKPSAYALLVLVLAPGAGLLYLLVLLACAVVGRGGGPAPGVAGALGLLVPFVVRVCWYRRHTGVEFRLHENGLVAVTARGREVVYPWRTTAVFTDGWDRFKLATPQGAVVTLGPPGRRPAFGGERIKGLRTRTVIRGAQVAEDEEWDPAIRQGVLSAQTEPAVRTALSGGEVPVGDLVLSRSGVTVRRGRGRDDFSAWQDVRSLELSPEGLLMISSRGRDFPTHFMRYRYRVANLDLFLALSRQLHENAVRCAPGPAAGTSEPAPPTPVRTPDAVPDSAGPDSAGPDSPPPGSSAPGSSAPDPSTPAPGSTAPVPVPAASQSGPTPAATAPSRPSPAPARTAAAVPRDEVLDLLSHYLVLGMGAWAAWALGTRDEIDGVGVALLAVVKAVIGVIAGMLAGLLVTTAIAATWKAGGEIVLEAAIRWFRHRRFVASAALTLGAFVGPLALLFLLFRAFPSRLVPLAMLLFFGGWAVLLAVARCLPSENAAVRHLPDAPAVLLVALACEQLVSGDVLTVAPAAGLFFPIALWLSWRGRRWMRTAPRRTVQAAADVVLSVELGLVLTLFMVWLANVLSFTPPQVTVVLEVVEKVQGLTEVHWLYWMAAYTALALGSYALLRWPTLVVRAQRRLRPARFGSSRLPVRLATNAVQRSFSGINIAVMVALIFLVAVAPVSEGAWKRPVERRYALEVERREYAEGSAAAYPGGSASASRPRTPRSPARSTWRTSTGTSSRAPAPARAVPRLRRTGSARAAPARPEAAAVAEARRPPPPLRPATQRHRGPRRRGESGTLSRRDGASPLRSPVRGELADGYLGLASRDLDEAAVGLHPGRGLAVQPSRTSRSLAPNATGSSVRPTWPPGNSAVALPTRWASRSAATAGSRARESRPTPTTSFGAAVRRASRSGACPLNEQSTCSRKTGRLAIIRRTVAASASAAASTSAPAPAPAPF
ncbi:hypothetical protein SCALM49S_09701 [Streptomyces californicus]